MAASATYDQVRQSVRETECQHDQDPFRRRRLSNGTSIAGRQCSICGRWNANGVRKVDIADFDTLPWYDEDLQERTMRARSERLAAAWSDLRAREQEAERDAWRDRYERYMHSPAWRSRADKVLRRAQYACEACGERRATQVHHLTYAHFENEPLFDLRAVCRPCHEEITRMDREARAR